jgi:cysteine synthase
MPKKRATKKGGTIIEATSGNGIGLAMVAAVKVIL